VDALRPAAQEVGGFADREVRLFRTRRRWRSENELRGAVGDALNEFVRHLDRHVQPFAQDDLPRWTGIV
jgi:hypothetical protein